MKLLHIIATPRENESNTLRVSNGFIENLHVRYPNLEIEALNLFNQDLMAVAGVNIKNKYSLMVGKPIDKNNKEAWNQIETLINHFLSADVYLITSPMWNFGIPYVLKYYIDAIVQPGYLYRYNEIGQPVPMTHGKKMVCITSRGGDYSANSPFHVYDFQEPYLRAIFGFIGITDMCFINAQPMDVTPALREAATSAALTEAANLAASFDLQDKTSLDPAAFPAQFKPKPI